MDFILAVSRPQVLFEGGGQGKRLLAGGSGGNHIVGSGLGLKGDWGFDLGPPKEREDRFCT